MQTVQLTFFFFGSVYFALKTFETVFSLVHDYHIAKKQEVIFEEAKVAVDKLLMNEKIKQIKPQDRD